MVYDIYGYYDGTVRFIITNKEPKLTKHIDYLEDVKKVVEKGIPINGIKGFSILSKLPDFDMVWGFAREYQHGDCLGNAKRFWEIWTDPKYKSPIRLTKLEQKAIDDRLMSQLKFIIYRAQ